MLALAEDAEQQLPDDQAVGAVTCVDDRTSFGGMIDTAGAVP